jgi:hypothetical protein
MDGWGVRVSLNILNDGRESCWSVIVGCNLLHYAYTLCDVVVVVSCNKQTKGFAGGKRKEGRELRHPAGYQILFGCQAEDTNPYPTNTKKRTKICIMLKNFEFDFN